MADYAPIVRKILSENGCHLERQGKGDHEIWYSPLTKLRFPVDGKKIDKFDLFEEDIRDPNGVRKAMQ